MNFIMIIMHAVLPDRELLIKLKKTFFVVCSFFLLVVAVAIVAIITIVFVSKTPLD